MLKQSGKKWPSYSQEEINKAVEILESGQVNYWTGREGKDFEKEFASYCGVEFAVAMSNGTVALELCLKALCIGLHNGGSETDEVIVTPRSFVASASVIVSAGAKPIFADVDPETGNINAQNIKIVLSQNTAAIILVHLAGWPCDFDDIIALVKDKPIKIIEDCAQAHGARYKGRSVGSLGDVAAWSFCQDKIISTAGEGGMVTTNCPDTWQRLWSLKDHGKNYEKTVKQPAQPGFRWLHDTIGTNARMTEIQAAIGRIQLRSIEEINTKRKFIADAILNVLAPYAQTKKPLLTLQNFRCRGCSDIVCGKCRNAFYNLYVHVLPKNLPSKYNRDIIVYELQSLGLPVRHGGCTEIYKEKAFHSFSEDITVCSNAQKMGETSIMFELHHRYTDNEIQQICNVLEKYFQNLAKC